MYYLNTEDGPEPIFKNSVWEIDFLLYEYTNDYIPTILKQGWAIDEMVAGVPMETLVDELWKSYEGWAEEKFYKQRGRNI